VLWYPDALSLAFIPNLVTLVRVFLTPVVIVAVVRAEYTSALWIFLAAGLTDGLDGWIARRFRWTSRVGAYLDPVADKLLLSGVFIALGLVEIVPWWLVGIVFGRDVAILAGAAVVFVVTGNRNFPPSVWGKASTLVQIVTLLALLAQPAWPLMRELLIWPVAVAAIGSGLDYLRRAVTSRAH
jgi:cardiolipin synthase (CMP-forming)